MNTIDKYPDYKKLYGFVSAEFNKTTHFKHGPFDETYFSLRVYESAKEIIRKLRRKVNVQQVLVAAILHDIGKIKLKTSKMFTPDKILKNAADEWIKHAKLSVPIAKKILKRLGHSEEFIQKVCYLIENHNFRDAKSKSIELKILQDADLIADIGFAGFIRAFLYSGKFRDSSVISSIRYLQKEDRTINGSQLNLAISRSIAKTEIKIQSNLIREISKELDSDLL
jgi:putative nucleotidyltransferase with HDIG domain